LAKGADFYAKFPYALYRHGNGNRKSASSYFALIQNFTITADDKSYIVCGSAIDVTNIPGQKLKARLQIVI